MSATVCGEMGGPMTTRRMFLQGASFGAGAILIHHLGGMALAADAPPLVNQVAAALGRLAQLGWRQLLLDVTGGELDIAAADLKSELIKPLAKIDRSYPGFGDFDAGGSQAIEPGSQSSSLLYHALASPTVVVHRNGAMLSGFPTLSEIEVIENYIYGVESPNLEELRQRAGGNPFGI